MSNSRLVVNEDDNDNEDNSVKFRLERINYNPLRSDIVQSQEAVYANFTSKQTLLLALQNGVEAAMQQYCKFFQLHKR